MVQLVHSKEHRDPGIEWAAADANGSDFCSAAPLFLSVNSNHINKGLYSAMVVISLFFLQYSGTLVYSPLGSWENLLQEYDEAAQQWRAVTFETGNAIGMPIHRMY